MKKILALLITIFTVIGLAACGGGQELNLVISKLFTATTADFTSGSPGDNVIELYNNTNQTLSMTNAAIRIYLNSNPNNTIEIPLSGTVAPNSFFIIVGHMHSVPEVVAMADFVHTTFLTIRGEDAVSLVWNGEVIDRIGYPDGVPSWVSGFSTLIRQGELNELTPVTDLRDQTFTAYLPNLWEYLGVWEHEIRTLEQLLAGPGLEIDRVSQLNFMNVAEDGSRSGGGGIVPANLVSITDGDTARFSGTEFISALGTNQTSIPLRYQYLQTPEIGARSEPWGHVATFYHNNYIHPNNAEGQTIFIQSIPGSQPLDMFARALGLVWVDGVSQAFLMYAEGLTITQAPGLATSDLGITYKNVPLLTFFLAAQDRAMELSLGVHSLDTAPDWNIFTNQTLGANPNAWNHPWTPHFPELLPWLSN